MRRAEVSSLVRFRIPCAHAAAVPRAHRPHGLPARPGHDDLGPRHRRARGPRPAGRVRRGRRHAARHRCRLRRRRVRGAARPAARRRSSPATRSCWPPRRAFGPAAASASSTPRAATCCARLDASLERLGVDHVDLWQVHSGPTTPRSRRRSPRSTTRSPPAARRTSGSATTRAGRPRRPRPGSAPSRGGPPWPPPRSSTPCSTAASSTRCFRPPRRSGWACCRGRRSRRGVLTGKYRTGTPADSRAADPRTGAAFVGGYLDRGAHPGRRGRRPRRRRPGLDADRRWRWPGCATGRA